MATTMPMPRSKPTPFPLHINPMLATLSVMPAKPQRYGFEFKWDGVRALSYIRGHQLRIESRNGLEIQDRYPEFADLHKLKSDAIFDGEIVSLNSQGIPDFSRLQRRMHVSPDRVTAALRQEFPAQYFIFDVLYWKSRPTLHEPYEARRKLLQQVIAPQLASFHALGIPPGVLGDGDSLWAAANAQHLEGIMAKELGSSYEPGRRSGVWRKIKLVQKQEFVVGGFMPESSGRAGRIGSLLVGVYQAGKLHYAGRVGTGLKAADHALLTTMLAPLVVPADPFPGQALPRGKIHFVIPQLVIEVEFRRWPNGGLVQQASFKGIRSDKSPLAVVKEVTHDA